MPIPGISDLESVEKAFTAIQLAIGEGNARRGFHQEGDQLRQWARESASPDDIAALRNYYMAKTALIMSEGAEALEDLRSGRPADKNHYTVNGIEVHPVTDGSGADWTTDPSGADVIEGSSGADTYTGVLPKPEGVPSEIADVVIRCFDFADEAGFSLIDAILEKLAYNETRARMHGKKV